MKRNKAHTIFFDGMKAVELWGNKGWNILAGERSLSNEAINRYKLIPTMYRSVMLRANSVANVPFEIRKGENVIDTSTDWQNKIGFMPNPFMLLQLVEMSLTLTGKAYLLREHNNIVVTGLRYLLFDSITPKIDSADGLTGFIRRVGAKPIPFEVEDIIHFWYPDPYVEIGSPISYPAQAALTAADVLLNVNDFASAFFKRGAIKAMLLTVEDMPIQAEREKLEQWWSNVVAGIKNAFGAKIINAKKVTPVVVGEGLKELEDVTLTREEREDIAIAMGIPMSILFSNAANYATSIEDDKHFFDKTIIPEVSFIESVLNEQLFVPIGYTWHFLPETLDVMQEDEKDRSQALAVLVPALQEPVSEVALEILGFELTDEQWEKLRLEWGNKSARTEAMLANLAGGEQPALPPTAQEKEQPMNADLERWQRKALKALEKKQTAAVEFDSEHIPLVISSQIAAALKTAYTAEQVKSVFRLARIDKPHDSTAFLAAELKRANDLLEASLIPVTS